MQRQRRANSGSMSGAAGLEAQDRPPPCIPSASARAPPSALTLRTVLSAYRRIGSYDRIDIRRWDQVPLPYSRR